MRDLTRVLVLFAHLHSKIVILIDVDSGDLIGAISDLHSKIVILIDVS